MYDLSNKKIFVSGHKGLVGSALVRRLQQEGCEILTATRSDMDLRRQEEVERWMGVHRPHAVIIAAAKVGGIMANQTYPADFIYENLIIEANLINASFVNDVEKLLFLGSSCIYPKLAVQPITEGSLLTGPLEPTNEWYAIAKIAGIKLCQAYRQQYGVDYISAMPTNLFGPNDNFDLNSSHVMPALIRKAHEAKVSAAPSITMWGTGDPLREFLHSDDCADALIFLLKNYSEAEHINVGSGEDLPILELTRLVCEAVGFTGEIIRDLSKPDGTPRKLMSADKLRAMGWTPSIPLKEGIRDAYNAFLKSIASEKVEALTIQ